MSVSLGDYSLLLSSFTGFIGGIVAWFCSNYIGRPIVKFWDLRSEAHQCLHYYDHIRSEHPGVQRDADEARRCFRWLAARVDALRTSSPALILRALAWRGYDLHGAAIGLSGLSDTLGSESSAAPFRVQAQRALKLPPAPDDASYADAKERIKGRPLW